MFVLFMYLYSQACKHIEMTFTYSLTWYAMAYIHSYINLVGVNDIALTFIQKSISRAHNWGYSKKNTPGYVQTKPYLTINKSGWSPFEVIMT